MMSGSLSGAWISKELFSGLFLVHLESEESPPREYHALRPNFIRHINGMNWMQCSFPGTNYVIRKTRIKRTSKWSTIGHVRIPIGIGARSNQTDIRSKELENQEDLVLMRTGIPCDDDMLQVCCHTVAEHNLTIPSSCQKVLAHQWLQACVTHALQGVPNGCHRSMENMLLNCNNAIAHIRVHYK
ncbi:hypothetical protein CAPTEDRAFT_209640 [Capitella teleta]|uniref:Uncharacterized protein n=1 Tax=Capitella teleta TaxID=283909 RepID=R7VGM4_CAPTE|nr:hypothetical protein CAPTEDRAFT_209640 [Capitella teleta]|eukprot:ELU17749.1 hypothetical protein CAPTEDRAFT_209640 [Capitella teleta]